ncbi:peroxisomal 2 4-dienoyl-CoA reductase sps19 [Fusarium falciforme]|nr:peroxisomal 2 4-dienoyl-CoA reductase sps19 [Fusarium falciforme]
MDQEKDRFITDVWRDGLFENKVVFCTGGNGTICSAQVKALVYLGANACIVGRNVSKTGAMAQEIAAERPGARVLGLGGVDVRDAKRLQDAADRCASELGAIDYVIAGAAGNFLAPVRELSPNAFKSVIDIDVLGSYNTVKATLPHLIQSASKNSAMANKGTRRTPSSGGKIVFISATMHYTGTPLQAHVCAAKAAVDALAHAICIEQGPLGVTSNVISPGPIADTEGTSRLFTEEKQSLVRQIPAGRLGSISDIADATIYLFSNAGNYVNGEILVGECVLEAQIVPYIFSGMTYMT